MNIQLYVENQLCDFDSKTYITLQKEFDNEAELIVTEVEYSYTIEIPTSVRNKQIFGFIDSFDVSNKFGRIYNAELYVDEMLILKGKLKLSGIDAEYFKGNLYKPASATVSDILGDRQLNEIIPHMKPMNNMTDMTQQNNYVMGMNTTDIPSAKYRDRHVCYPYLLYSLPYNDGQKASTDDLDFYTQRLDFGYHTMNNDNIFPSFNVCSVIKDMFKTEGYNIQGNIFDDEKFKDLYQTFQYSYSDYLDKRLVPYYLSFRGDYDNYRSNNIPASLQVATLWTESDYDVGHDGHFDGTFQYGVDCPLQAGSKNTRLSIISNEQHMLSEGQNYDGYAITIPQDGWYRIHCDGQMSYPDRSGGWKSESNRENVGGTQDRADTTDLSEQPFEFQIKKGYPAENPQLYSFNSFIPCMPTHYSEGASVKCADEHTYIKCMTNERSRLYGKNGKTTYIKEYSDFPTSDFVCGARLGGAWFNTELWGTAGRGGIQRPNRFALKGAGLALPDVTKTLQTRDMDDDGDGDMYFMIAHSDGNNRCEYAEKTAQVLVRQDSYSNFEGYNVIDFGTKRWDTTRNEGAVVYPGAANNSASTSGKYGGKWDINTVVWLEKGDTINIELLIPYHFQGDYQHSTLLRHSKWKDRHEYINRTMVSFNFEMGIISTDKKWIPTDKNPIPTFDYIRSYKETNVNQFLPTLKCNDYLNNLLQTFNLQLTMPNKNTFSIDYAAMNNVMGNVISIDNLANIKDAEFKALDTPSQRQLSWKVDTSETGYYHGNPSPYKTENLPWYNSGYTGSITITNETNTSGSIDKKESSWSYCWYKDIKFVNGLGLSVKEAPIAVLAENTIWDDGNSYMNAQSESLNTSKTMRFFLLGKNVDTSMYKYIEFKYDENNGRDLNCRLVIPSNYIETKQSQGSKRYYMLDYNNSVQNTDGGNKKTITDIFFNLYVQSGYQIDVPIKLTNNLYNRINGGTLIRFNDGLYKVKSIDGHDVTEQDEATLSLLTLK